MRLDAIGFGSLNLDEFWEVSRQFLRSHDLRAGEEYVRDLVWFQGMYPELKKHGRLVGSDPGGSAANMIAALRRMGFRTGFYGVLGRDDIRALRPEELGNPEDLRIREVDPPAGRCLALIDTDDPHRDRALIITPNANDLAGIDVPEPEYFAEAQWIHLTSFVSENPLGGQVAVLDALPDGTRVSFDPGAVYASRGVEALKRLLKRTSILFVTPEEVEELTSDSTLETAVEKVQSLGVETVIVKLGAQGIRGFRQNRSLQVTPPTPRRIRDRTGAGDVAAAGFLAGTLRGFDLELCLKVSVAAATRSIEGYGRSSYPDQDFFDKVAGQAQVSNLPGGEVCQ